jgi:UDP-glucose 4-epimerase
MGKHAGLPRRILTTVSNTSDDVRPWDPRCYSPIGDFSNAGPDAETTPTDCYGPSVRERPIIVTGGAGFVGSHLCDRLLADGHRVVAVDDLVTGRTENLSVASRHGDAFGFAETDIRTPRLLDVFESHRPDVVMHLAAQAGVRPSLEDPDHDASVNVLGTLNVLRCATSVGCRKVVYAASGGTLYGEPTSLPVRESSADGAHPESPYGISKKVVLDYLRFFSRHRSLEFVALALGNVYGPRQDPTGEAGVISIFASSMLSGRSPTIFGDGEQTRDYVYVEDTVAAFAAAMDRGSGEVINIGTGIETSVNALHTMLCEIVGIPAAPRYGPQPEGELRRIALDNSHAASVLGWRPRTDLAVGLARTVEHLRESYSPSADERSDSDTER